MWNLYFVLKEGKTILLQFPGWLCRWHYKSIICQRLKIYILNDYKILFLMSFFPKDIFSVYMIISKTTGSILSIIVLTIYFNFLEICCVIFGLAAFWACTVCANWTFRKYHWFKCYSRWRYNLLNWCNWNIWNINKL